MPHSRSIVSTSIGFTISAAGTWCLVAYWTYEWVHLRALSLLRPVAAVLTIAALLCWLTCWLACWLREIDPEKEALKREKVLLVKTLGGVVPMAETKLRRRIPVHRVP